MNGSDWLTAQLSNDMLGTHLKGGHSAKIIIITITLINLPHYLYTYSHSHVHKLCSAPIHSALTCCNTLTIHFTPLCIICHSHHTDSIRCARSNASDLCSHLISDNRLVACVQLYMVLYWDSLKAGSVMCPGQRNARV